MITSLARNSAALVIFFFIFHFCRLRNSTGLAFILLQVDCHVALCQSSFYVFPVALDVYVCESVCLCILKCAAMSLQLEFISL